MHEEESALLVNRWRDGDEDAAQVIFDRYVDRLIALARSRLGGKLQRRVTAEDVVQSAYRSFFRGATENRFTFKQTGDLWRLLSTITLNKLRRQYEFHGAKKRSTSDEESVVDDLNVYRGPEKAARDPTSEEAAALIEELERVMEGLPQAHRTILQLQLQGESFETVSSETNRTERTIRRVLEKVRSQLESRLLDFAPESEG